MGKVAVDTNNLACQQDRERDFQHQLVLPKIYSENEQRGVNAGAGHLDVLG